MKDRIMEIFFKLVCSDLGLKSIPVKFLYLVLLNPYADQARVNVDLMAPGHLQIVLVINDWHKSRMINDHGLSIPDVLLKQC